MKFQALVCMVLFLGAISNSCTKEATKTQLEETMESQGWTLVENPNFVPFSGAEENANEENEVTKEDTEYFVAIDEKKVFMRKGFRQVSNDLVPTDFKGIPADFDIKNLSREQAKPQQKSVIYNDDRQPIPWIEELKSYPSRIFGSLTDCSTCLTGYSGILIGPRHVLTAARCLYNDNGWVDELFFSPGQLGREEGVSGTPERPNGTPRRAKYYYARSRESVGTDYGLVILEDEARTARLGWSSLMWYNNLNAYDDLIVDLVGFPRYHQIVRWSPRSDNLAAGFMYQSTWNRLYDIGETYIDYQFDTQSGQEGSPIYDFVPNYGCLVIGIHRGPRNNTRNWGCRIRPEVAADIRNWMSNWPSRYASHPWTD